MSTAAGPHPGTVLVIGEFAPGCLAQSLLHAFSDLGWATERIAWDANIAGPLASVLLRFPETAAPLRRRLRGQVAGVARRFPCRLVLVLKGALLDAPTIDAIRQLTSAPVVCWNPDSPFGDGISNSAGGIFRAIPAYDAYVTWADDVAHRISQHRDRVLVVPFGFDPHLHYPDTSASVAPAALVFIGTWTRDRQASLEALRAWRPVVFGNDWPKGSGIDIRPAVSGADYRRAVTQARWCLNFLRPQNARSHNMRSFEVPACGGRQLASRSDDHQAFLAGTSARLFGSHDELIAHLEAELPSEPAQGPDFTQHSYAARAAALLSALGLAS